LSNAITWRVSSSAITVILGWITLGNPLVELKIGIIELGVKFVLYYLHERLWYRSNFGMKQKNTT